MFTVSYLLHHDYEHEHEQEQEYERVRRSANYPCHPRNPWYSRLSALAFLACLADEPALRAAHVGASAGIDLDRFAFFDEERDVNGLTGLEFRRFGHVAGGIAADAYG
jgi:hypothetical protein